MKYLSYLILASIATGAISCSPEPILISIPPAEQQIVVFSQIVPEELMAVSLTSTFGALDFNEEEGDTISDSLLEELSIRDAEVTVSYRDQTDTLSEVGEGTGLYLSTSTPQFTNEAYTLKVITADDRELSATSVMLAQVRFDSLRPVIRYTDFDTIVTVRFTLSDLPEDNRYMINYFVPENGENEGGNLFLPGASRFRRTVLLHDAEFTGNQFSGVTELFDVGITDTLVVSVSNISEPYYRFLQAQAAADNFLALLTQEPVSSPSNVNGGLGFFNTHFPQTVVFDLNEY